MFVYTTLLNIYERPEGIKIASWFIATIIVTSMVSRVLRSTELRIHSVEADDLAKSFIQAAAGVPVRILAIRPGDGRREAYEAKMREARESHHLPEDQHVLFLEVKPGDVSNFSGTLKVAGADVGGYHVLRSKSPAIPNAIAALLLYVRDLTREVLRQTEPNPVRRPRIHVG